MNEEDWNKAGGIFCSSCNQEVVRLKDGLCMECYNEQELKRIEKQEEKSMRRYYRRELNKGTVSISQMKEGRL